MNDNKKQVPEWSLELTERLMSNKHIRPLPSSAIIVHSEDKDEQFKKYIERQFTLNDAEILKNQLNETSKGLKVQQEKATTTTTVERKQQEKEDQQYEERIWWLSKDDQDGFYSICGLFFLFGFLFPPFWWIGSVWPKHVAERGGKMAVRWQKLNRIMSIGFSSILLILIIIFVVLYTTT